MTLEEATKKIGLVPERIRIEFTNRVQIGQWACEFFEGWAVVNGDAAHIVIVADEEPGTVMIPMHNILSWRRR